MILQIPLPTPPVYDFDLQADLDGVTFTLGVFYNSRDGGWYLNIGAADSTPILAGQRVVVDYPIGWKQTAYNPLMPAGALQWSDTSGQGIDPGQFDIGARVVLLYFDLAEMQAQVAGTGVNVNG
jgi:hypothetical protein